MNPKTLVVLGAAVVAIVASIAIRRQREPVPNDFIYLLDARSDSSTPLEQALPAIKRLARNHGAKVDVRATASVSQLRDYRSMLEEFDRTRVLVDPSPIFFALDQPYTTTKKALRAAIDQGSLQGASRVQLLERLVIVRDTERLNERGECSQLDDDVTYATSNFLGIGLLVHDGTLQNLTKCIELIAPDS
jgi:hypothetical protein